MPPVKSLLEMTLPEAECAFAETRLAVIPVGSIEQHGPHLPLGTDFMGAAGMARVLAEKMKGILVPFSPIGVAPYHMSWKGTLSLKPSTFINMFVEVCECLYQHGTREILVVIGHEGDITPIRMAADEAQRLFDGLRFVVTESYRVVNKLYPELELTHAAKQELVQVMLYDPSFRADHTKVIDASDRAIGNREHERYRRNDVYPILKDFREVAPTGYYGIFEQPSPESVAEILDKSTDYVVSQAREIFKAAREGYAAHTRGR